MNSKIPKGQPKVGGIKDLTDVIGSHHHKTEYREMWMPSFEMRVIVGKVLQQVRIDKGYSTDSLAKMLRMRPNTLAVRESLGFNTIERFIDHCETLKVDPVEIFADCYHLHKKYRRY